MKIVKESSMRIFKVGDLVMNREETASCLYGIIVYKVKPNIFNPTTDRWWVQWNDGDDYALPECLMEVISESR